MAHIGKLDRSAASAHAAGDDEFLPKTSLGRRLWELRQQVLATGAPLLSWEEIEREVSERRGEERA